MTAQRAPGGSAAAALRVVAARRSAASCRTASATTSPASAARATCGANRAAAIAPSTAAGSPASGPYNCSAAPRSAVPGPLFSSARSTARRRAARSSRRCPRRQAAAPSHPPVPSGPAPALAPHCRCRSRAPRLRRPRHRRARSRHRSSPRRRRQAATCPGLGQFRSGTGGGKGAGRTDTNAVHPRHASGSQQISGTASTAASAIATPLGAASPGRPCRPPPSQPRPRKGQRGNPSYLDLSQGRSLPRPLVRGAGFGTHGWDRMRERQQSTHDEGHNDAERHVPGKGEGVAPDHESHDGDGRRECDDRVPLVGPAHDQPEQERSEQGAISVARDAEAQQHHLALGVREHACEPGPSRPPRPP